MGSQNVSLRSKSVAAKALSIAIPSRLSIPTQAASNVPRPSGIGPRVAAIDAMMKLTNGIQIAGVSPNARNASQSVSASSTKTANSRITVSPSKTGLRSRSVGAFAIACSRWAVPGNRRSQAAGNRFAHCLIHSTPEGIATTMTTKTATTT